MFIRKKIISKVFLLCTLLILSGCTSESDKIIFVDKLEFDVDGNINSCTLVKKVNDKEISSFDYNGNRINIDDENSVLCPKINTTKIGKQKLKYYYSGKEYCIVINILDKQKPIIKCDTDEIHIDIGQNKENVLEKVSITDHDNNLKVEIVGINYEKAGEYTASIIVEDTSKNKAIKAIKIFVDDKKENITKEEPDKNESKENKEDKNASSTINLNRNDEKRVVAENRDFLFTQGYDYQTCYSASVAYAKEMLTSGKANGYECIPIRNNKQEYIGYRVIFN